MTRFIALLVVALLIYLALAELLRAARRSVVGRQIEALLAALRQPSGPSQPSGSSRKEESLLELVRCASCGVHVPRAAAERGSHGYVCERCRARARTA